MNIQNKTSCCCIINSTAVVLTEGQVVSYRDDAIVQEFETKEEMFAAHREQFPDQWQEEEV